MAALEKYIFQTWNDLQTFLTAKGFTIANNKITYDLTPNDTDCYWSYTSAGTVNFVTSEGDNAFYHNLTDFENGKYCGCVWVELKDNGFILFLSPIATDFDIADLTLCCVNNYHCIRIDAETRLPVYEDDNNPLENGVVVCTPAEQDEYWRFSWRDKDIVTATQRYTDPLPPTYKWNVDNTQGIVTVGTEIPYVQMIQAPLTATLLKVYLINGAWSEYIYTQVLGEINPPGDIFKINGQKFISISDNTIYRCPVFKLAPEEEGVNPSSSTEEYRPTRTYKVDDYCIYEGLLWKCRQAVTVPMAFDQTYWYVTTVPYELQNN